MRTAKRTICLFIMVALMLSMLGTSVFATESGNVWLNVTETAEGNTQVSVVTDEAVTDAFVELTFDSASLHYIGIETNSDCVGVYSVNADEEGMVKIAWVSDGDYAVDEAGVSVLTFIFTGVAETIPAMSGQINDAEGNALNILESVKMELDKNELTKAVLIARNLDAAPYTAESYETMRAVLAEAEAVLANALTQAELDAAAQALLDAIEALELAKSGEDQQLNYVALEKAILKAEALNRYDYTKESYSAVEAALNEAKAVLEAADATQEQVDAAALALNEAIRALVLGIGVPDTGTDSLTMPLVALVILSAMGVVATVCLLNSKKGRCAK